MPYRRILVPVDGSSTSNKALTAALALARERGSQIRVVHSLEEFPMASGFEYSVDVVGVVRDHAQKTLADALALVHAAGIEGESHLLETSGKRLGEAVADEAQAWSADLVVVGTHGRRGLSRALLGSGAESVIRQARVPVLVIRGDDAAASS